MVQQDLTGCRLLTDINGLSVQLPKSFQIRHMEDNQATITLLLSGQAGVLRHTDRTQRVSFGWLKQQYENGEFRLLNVGTAEQTADVFTKPFTEKSKWIHALRLIGHTSSAHAGCKPVSSKGEAKTTAAALSDGIKVVEDFAKSALESNKLDFPTFEKLASLVRHHLKSSLSRARPLMTQDTQSSYLVFGAWVRGGLFGITKKTLRSGPTYQGYTQAQWDEWNRSRQQSRRYTQAEWDAWNRSRRY